MLDCGLHEELEEALTPIPKNSRTHVNLLISFHKWLKYEPAFIKIYSFFSGVKKIMRILPDSCMGNSPGFQDLLYTLITRIMVLIITKGLPLLNRLSNHSNSLIHITPLWECAMLLMMMTLPPDKMMKR